MGQLEIQRIQWDCLSIRQKRGLNKAFYLIWQEALKSHHGG